MNGHIQEYKRHIWRNLGEMRDLVNSSEDKWATAKFLWRLKSEMGATIDG